MISDVDKTIEKLFHLEWGAPLPFDLSFVLPDKEFGPVSESRHTLNCYLYDICENLELRSNEPQFKRRGDGTVDKKTAPARIKLSYCMTAWSPAKATQGIDPALDEHKMLSQVLVLLLKYPVLPEKVLQGQLKNLEIPIPTTVALPNGIKNPGDFWNAIGGQLRPSLDYSVTIALDFKDVVTGPQVSSKILTYQYQQGGEPQGDVTYVQIGGYIYNKRSPSQPAVDAWVLVEETGQTGKTDSRGCYRLGNLNPGTYTISVRARGYKDDARKITVPAAKGEYNIPLTPG